MTKVIICLINVTVLSVLALSDIHLNQVIAGCQSFAAHSMTRFMRGTSEHKGRGCVDRNRLFVLIVGFVGSEIAECCTAGNPLVLHLGQFEISGG
jgi:hypothetical protein